ncbi:MAG: hypothetical protein IJP19_03740 [Clostridia bacterium]|nr:hypothetical protein [Clostridia bacterium]
MKKTLLALVFSIAFVILVSTTVFAADITYDNTTYTEINDGADMQITVSYTVSDYTEGEQVTLRVLTGTDEVQYDPEDETKPINIAYADQQAITGESGSFTFILAKSLIEENRIYVKLGSTTMETPDSVVAPVVTDGAVTVTDLKGIISEFTGGYDGSYAQQGTAVTFTVNRGLLASDIKYRVYDSINEVWGEYVPLTPDANDLFTIPGNAITGNIEIEAQTLGDGIYVQLITRDKYSAVVKETLGKQICAIFGTSAQDTYTVNGKEAYWSSRYNAHVVWIDSFETLITLAGDVEVTEGKAATEIVYDGDINGRGGTTAADSTFVKDSLFGTRLLPTTDMQLFKLDVDANMQVTTADIVQILRIAVGK